MSGQPRAAVQEFGYYIHGEFHVSGERLEVRARHDHTLVAVTYWTPEAAIEQAVQAAVATRATMARLDARERSAILHRMADAVAARSAELVRWLALEAGKPVKAGRVEVDRCVFTLRNSAEEALRIPNEIVPLDAHPAGRGRFALVRRVPVGTVLAITPFNFPVNLVAHKLGPAIAAGCPVVQKPSPKTPVTSLVLAEIARDAGLPAGALSVIQTSDEQAQRLCADDRFQLLSFTGSAAVGWQLKARAGKKRVVLELGGNAGCIVHSDADLDYAAERCIAGGFAYSGQSCISVQRIFVHRPVYEQFVARLVERAEALRVGEPLAEETDVGPMITEAAAARVADWVAEAIHGGARALCGARREGAFYYPTVLVDTAPGMRVNCEEVFGPVVTVAAYDDFDRALEAVNASPYGLQAGVFTRDLERIQRAWEVLEVGGVIANDVPTFRVDHMPYGGVKESGLGREGPRYAIEEMTERRLLVLSPSR
jgi:acyl-CoA reductase-like NAD-dependent aldehyde dehydrogenase